MKTLFFFLTLSFVFTVSCFFSQPTFFKEKGLWGLKDKKGKVLVYPKYSNVNEPYFGAFDFPYADVIVKGKIGFIDEKGIEVVPPQYDQISNTHLGPIIQVKKGNKWGLYNLNLLKELTPIIYDIFDYERSIYEYIDSEFVESYLIRTNIGGYYEDNNVQGGKWGLIKVNQRSFMEIVPNEYDDLDVHLQFIPVQKDEKWGCVDFNGKLIIPTQYSYLEPFPRLGLILASIEGGQLIQNSSWSGDRHYAGGKWGFLDTAGKVVVPLQYDYIRPKPVGLEQKDSIEYIKVGLNNLFGIIDQFGKEVLPLKFDEISDNIFSYNDFMDIWPYDDVNGLFKVKANGFWGMVDHKNEVVIPFQYDDIYYANDHYEAILKTTIKFDKSGKEIKD